MRGFLASKYCHNFVTFAGWLVGYYVKTMLSIIPIFAATNAASYAIQNATPEGKVTFFTLLILSFFSWGIIITKFRQLVIANKATKKFMAAYSGTRDPLDIQRKGEQKEFDGAPAYQLFVRGAD